MKNQSNSLGDISTSPTGQICLWATAVGVGLMMAFSYLNAYPEITKGALDRVDHSIVAVTKRHKSRPALRAHRRHRPHPSHAPRFTTWTE
jgi:hypothetical protein